MIDSLKIYQKSKACQALMNMKHRHMVCGELHTCHDLVLDQNVNDNAYSTPYRHKALDVDQKMVMLGIILYYNTFSLICDQQKNYPEHDTPCIFLFF